MTPPKAPGEGSAGPTWLPSCRRLDTTQHELESSSMPSGSQNTQDPHKKNLDFLHPLTWLTCFWMVLAVLRSRWLLNTAKGWESLKCTLPLLRAMTPLLSGPKCIDDKVWTLCVDRSVCLCNRVAPPEAPGVGSAGTTGPACCRKT